MHDKLAARTASHTILLLPKFCVLGPSRTTRPGFHSTPTASRARFFMAWLGALNCRFLGVLCYEYPSSTSPSGARSIKAGADMMNAGLEFRKDIKKKRCTMKGFRPLFLLAVAVAHLATLCLPAKAPSPTHSSIHLQAFYLMLSPKNTVVAVTWPRQR